MEARHLHIRVGFGTQLDGSVQGTVDQLTPGIGHIPHTFPWKSSPGYHYSNFTNLLNLYPNSNPGSNRTMILGDFFHILARDISRGKRSGWGRNAQIS